MFITSMVRHFEEIRSPCAYSDYHPHGVACTVTRDGIESAGAVRLRNGWMIVLFFAVAFSLVTIVFLLIQYNKTDISESKAQLVWHGLEEDSSPNDRLLNNAMPDSTTIGTLHPFVPRR